jgi:hypothetical protein
MAEPVDSRRVRRREFIRTHHPDRGGDPESFIAGLAEFDDRPFALNAPPRVFVVPKRRLPTVVVDWVTRPLRKRRQPPRVH